MENATKIILKPVLKKIKNQIALEVDPSPEIDEMNASLNDLDDGEIKLSLEDGGSKEI